MNLLKFVGIALLAGIVSGTAHSGLNMLAVQPFIDQAIEIEVRNQIDAGEEVNIEDVEKYRVWQKGSSILAGSILGLSFASLYAVVYGYARGYLPGSSDLGKGILLAAIMWLTIFMIPFLKYPANPPAVGDPETIYYRQTLYISFVMLTALGALGSALLYRRMRSVRSRAFIVPPLYALYITAAFYLMPPNPDSISIPMDLVTNFRIASAATATAFWLILGLVFGTFWSRFKLYVGLPRRMD